MVEMTLHPCAAQMVWHSAEPLAEGDWIGVLCRFLESLGENCMNTGASLIGHIKGIAVIADQPLLSISLVSDEQPAQVGGSVPDNTSELRLTLNVLVYGLSATDVAAVLGTTCEEALLSWQGNIEIEFRPTVEPYLHAVHDVVSQ